MKNTYTYCIDLLVFVILYMKIKIKFNIFVTIVTTYYLWKIYIYFLKF